MTRPCRSRRPSRTRSRVGDPADPATKMGPISNRAQYDKVQRMIGIGIEEGARLVAGGPGRPSGLERGFYARPTVFADVHNDMAIAREEIFGPVLTIIPYDGEEDAIAIANRSEYGLAGYIASSRSGTRATRGGTSARRVGADQRRDAGRHRALRRLQELGQWARVWREGLAEFLECKSVTV